LKGLLELTFVLCRYGGCLVSLCVSAAFAAIPKDNPERVFDI
jgi:hypothetical protein